MKKLLSLLLALAMVISMVPSVFATEEEGGAAVDTGVSGGTDVGLWADAEITDLSTMDTTLVAGDADGYIYSWIAEEDGNVSFGGYVDSEEEVTPEFDIIIYCGDTVVSRLESGEASVDVVAGDKVYVQIVALPDENGAYPAMTICAWGTFTPPAPPAGSIDNPIYPEFEWNEAQTEATATVIAPVGTTYYAVYGAGMMLSINGGEPTLLVANGMGRVPAIFTITNDGEAEAEYTLKLTYPVGVRENPEALELGWNDTSLEEGSFEGYFYTWTAKVNGTLSAYISSVTEGAVVDIVFTNNNTYQQLSLLNDGVEDEYGDLILNMDVAAGDEIAIQVVANPDADWKIPAAEVSWVTNFTEPAGSVNNPIFPEFAWNEEQTEATATVIAPVGTTYYAVWGAGMMLSINGGEPTLLVANGIGRVPAVFTITNDGEAEAEYALKLTYPVGAMENPAALVIGENTADIAAGTQGYYFSWIAEKDGTLTITMPDGNWTYALNNMTSYIYGDTQWSDSDPVVKVASIDVKAGDEIQLIVNTYDPANPWAAPAGKLVITAAFAEPEPEVTLEIVTQPVDAPSVVGKNAIFSIEATSNETINYVWYFRKSSTANWAVANSFSGYKTANLTVPVKSESYMGWEFYCKVTLADGSLSVDSEIAKIVAKPANLKVISNQKSADAVAVNRAMTFVVTVRDLDNQTVADAQYRWQYTTNGTTWNNVDNESALTRRMTIKASSGLDGAQFRCKITDAEGAYIYSEPLTLSILPNNLNMTTNPDSVEIVKGKTAIFTADVENYVAPLKYQWYYSKNGTDFYKSGLTGNTSNTLQVTAYASRDGFWFRCVISDGVGNVIISEAAQLVLKTNPLVIEKQPTAVTTTNGGKATFSVEATGFVGEAKYQWYYKTTAEGAKWFKADGLGAATTPTLEFSAQTRYNGWKFYCVVSDAEGNVLKSNGVTLFVN